MGKLVLVRHGLSRWNLQNRFSGWVDITLSKHGIDESQNCARSLRHIQFDKAYTSTLSRAQSTLLIILSEQNKTGIFLHEGESKHSWQGKSNIVMNDEIPIFDTPKLNERYYGELQGLDKSQARKLYGEDKVLEWRRSYSSRPPRGESLKDVYKRIVPFFTKKIVKELKEDRNILVVAHGNSLRAIVKFIEGITDEDIVNLEIPTGKPLVYNFIKNTLILEEGNYNFDRKVYWSKAVFKN